MPEVNRVLKYISPLRRVDGMKTERLIEKHNLDGEVLYHPENSERMPCSWCAAPSFGRYSVNGHALCQRCAARQAKESRHDHS